LEETELTTSIKGGSVMNFEGVGNDGCIPSWLSIYLIHRRYCWISI